MTDHILDLSEEGASLKVRHANLLIAREAQPEVTVPLAEIAALVLAHPQIRLSQAVLTGLAEAGGVVVVCDARRMPSGMLLPLAGNSVQTERFAQQVNAALPLKKRLWQQVVKAKIKAQARVLDDLHGDDLGLAVLATKVKSGDEGNLEAQASRRYWPALFADKAFRRNPAAEDQNRYLNYGYAILRGIVARAICGAGLHPSLGLHHHNRYDAFCLANDLMEPFRPLVDRAVCQVLAENPPEAPMTKEIKAILLQGVTGRLELEGESRTLFDVAARCATSLVAAYGGQRKSLLIGEL